MLNTAVFLKIFFIKNKKYFLSKTKNNHEQSGILNTDKKYS